jgi:hypothetical protein
VAASRAPDTISSGARSPPMASTATRITWLRSRGAERLDLAAAVGLAVGAHPVRSLGLAALGAEVQARRLEPVRGSALVAA